jgi:cytochrome c biogenesis factor
VIAELGQYALMLALGLALIQGSMPIAGTRGDDPVLMAVAVPVSLAQFLIRRARCLLRDVRFLGSQRLRKFQFGNAVDLPLHEPVGKS